MRIRAIVLGALSVALGGACVWYGSNFYAFNGQGWNVVCGQLVASVPPQHVGACQVDGTDSKGQQICTLTNPNTMGTWTHMGRVDAQGYLLTLTSPPQRVVPNKHTPEDFRLWSLSGANGIGQGQKGPVPQGGLPACPVP